MVIFLDTIKTILSFAKKGQTYYVPLFMLSPNSKSSAIFNTTRY